MLLFAQALLLSGLCQVLHCDVMLLCTVCLGCKSVTTVKSVGAMVAGADVTLAAHIWQPCCVPCSLQAISVVLAGIAAGVAAPFCLSLPVLFAGVAVCWLHVLLGSGGWSVLFLEMGAKPAAREPNTTSVAMHGIRVVVVVMQARGVAAAANPTCLHVCGLQ